MSNQPRYEANNMRVLQFLIYFLLDTSKLAPSMLCSLYVSKLERELCPWHTTKLERELCPRRVSNMAKHPMYAAIHFWTIRPV
jgi:hypothetical protein